MELAKGNLTGGSPPGLHSLKKGQIKNSFRMEQKTKKRTAPVLVLNKDGIALMPTRRFGWVRRGLRDGKLKVVCRDPFMVQLCYDIPEPVTQTTCAGIDIGHTHIGISVTTDKQELFAMQIDLRTNIKETLHERAGYRHGRRYRNCGSRPKKKDFGRPEGWLTPTSNYIATIHVNIINFLRKILPITNVRVELCKFDFQLMMNPEIIGADYQNGPQRDYDNTRQYIIARDHCECQICHGASRDKHLQVHHIDFRSNGGTNIPSNLITLCETCHKKLHAKKVELNIKKTEMPNFRPAAAVNIVSREIVRRIKALGLNVETTFGYITNYERKQHNIEKSHVNDAFVISGNINAKRLDVYFKGASFKRHYRKLHEAQPRKNMFYWHRRKDGTLKRIDKKGKDKNKKYGKLPDGRFIEKPRRPEGNAGLICGFAIRDIVRYNNALWFIVGRRATGRFEIKNIRTGKKLPKTINAKYLKLVQRSKPLMITEICDR